MKRSKAYTAAAAKVDVDKLYGPLEAVRLARETSLTKNPGTVEVALCLGVDPRKADQMVRGTVNLPHGTGKTARVLVFATGDRAEEAKAAGADIVGADELIDRVAGGFLDFDAAIAQGSRESLEKAVALYRGPLLEGCTEEWVWQERQIREQAFLGALERLAHDALLEGDHGTAVRHLRRAAAVDPFRESSHRQLMSALAAAGDYERHGRPNDAARLRDEAGLIARYRA